MNNNIVFWVLLIIIIIINIIIVIYIGLLDTNAGNNFLDSNFLRIDTIYHASATNQNLYGYLNLIDVSNYDFISLVNLSIKTPQFNYVSGISDKPGNYTTSLDDAKQGLTINNQYMQGFTELKHLGNYNAISFKHSVPVSEYSYYTDNKYIQCYSRTFMRLSDNIKYTFYQINITADNDYSYLKSLLTTISLQTPDIPKFIVGNFNIHGHEKVFNDIFKSDYIICPMYKTITVNNKINGYSAFDGLVVSKKLYKFIKYKIDFAKSDIDRYILTAQLYQTGFGNTVDMSDYKFKNYVKYLSTNNNTPNNIGKEGNYITSPTTTININKGDITTTDPNNFIVYSNELFNKKINTIELVSGGKSQ